MMQAVNTTCALVSDMRHIYMMCGVAPPTQMLICSGSDDEVDEQPIETTADTELYKLTLPMDVTAAPQVGALGLIAQGMHKASQHTQ